MEKLKMHTPDFTNANIAKLLELFPNCRTETKGENGKIKPAIDFDKLKQELSSKVEIVDGQQERYHLDWPGKREALLTANAPIAKTLRPSREESVDFDTTKNLYIEGDNLDALKLLQETYLGKVKMIYIDPPYNTGNDFIYEDDFAENKDAYFERSMQVDEEGNRLVANTDSNGRFHSDWLSMMYTRLRLARNLLRDDGVAFISIDDNEQANLKRMCDEVFGEDNFVACLPTIMNLKGNNDEFGFAGTHEYTIVYLRNKDTVEDLYGIALTEEDISEYEFEDEFGKYKKGATLMRTGEAGYREKRPKGYYPIYVSRDFTRISVNRLDSEDFEVYPKNKSGKEMSWRRSPETLKNSLSEFIVVNTNNGISFYKKQRLADDLVNGRKPKSLFYKPSYSSGNGTAEIKELFGERYFDNPKPTSIIKDFEKIGSKSGDIILDFFSGSATSAHAMFQLNAEDAGNRQFIMVQLPEATEGSSHANKAGYKTIAEIGKERIRRAGKKIKEEAGLMGAGLDIGFRVLKVDTSNMKDVYYSPDTAEQANLLDQIGNVKEDRTSEDLLFQVLLDWGVDLALPISKETMSGKTVFFVDENALAACFDTGVDEDFVKQLASRKPLRAVFRDSGFASDAVKINVEQIFKLMSPTTEVKSI